MHRSTRIAVTFAAFISVALLLAFASCISPATSSGYGVDAAPIDQAPHHQPPASIDTHPPPPPLADASADNRSVTPQLFLELEELARLVDISYCVGVSGIRKPFRCLSRCGDFPNYELLTTWNTGPLLSDSCGYIVLDHEGKRVLVAFRGTYSVANTIVDLTTTPQVYVPWPGDPDDGDDGGSFHGEGGAKSWKWLKYDIHTTPISCTSTGTLWLGSLRRLNAAQRAACRYFFSAGASGYDAQAALLKAKRWGTPTDKPAKTQVSAQTRAPKCENCTVHAGFLKSWMNTREVVLGHLAIAKHEHPEYAIHLVGHSLGGAVAALAGLEMESKGWRPTVTTLGEPRVGNVALRDYVDFVFDLGGAGEKRFRRVTHKDDPVPLLPLTEWGYRMHAGEIFIGSKSLPPGVEDLQHCVGDEDMSCIAGAEAAHFESRGQTAVDGDYDVVSGSPLLDEQLPGGRVSDVRGEELGLLRGEMNGVEWPGGLKLWELFWAHRDYFWRLGLCVPGGDPRGWLGRRRWYRGVYGEGEEEEEGGLEMDAGEL